MVSNENSTIAAISTPAGTGAIGAVRLSGNDAIRIAEKVFRCGKNVSEMPGYTAAYGRITDTRDGKETVIDDAVMLVYRAPHSYTGEDMAEFFCHGGDYMLSQVVKTLVAAGATPALPGEYTKRAFLNGKMSLTQAEAVMELISSKASLGMEAARERLSGKLGAYCEDIRKGLVALCAHFAAWIDYPEEDVDGLTDKDISKVLCSAEKRLEKLEKSYNAGKILSGGLKVAIAGKPNAGKSTLMNALAREERSIVTDIAGTTRDVVEERVRIGGLEVILSDTAGIRETRDEVERIGVERARKKIKESDLLIAVFDGSAELSAEDREVFELMREKPSVAAINKSDLGISEDMQTVKDAAEKFIEISAARGDGIDELEKIITAFAGISDRDGNEPILANERQLDCVRRAKNNVVSAFSALEEGVTYDAIAVLIEEAAEILGELSGENVREEMINEIFSRFCVGK